MGTTAVLLGAIAVYAAFILAIALMVEAKPTWRRFVENSPIVYALSLAVYNTTWSFYGSVGLAAQSGFMFLPITLGVVISATLWWVLLRRMVRVKAERRVTSIADFISARYDNSQFVAMLVTCMALLGSLPYVALQMRAILSTLHVAALSIEGGDSLLSGVMLNAAGPMLVAFTSVFTIIVGVRRLDPTERHHGMVAAVAVESVVKLVALVAVGIYVTWGLFDGVGDLFRRVENILPTASTGIGDGSAAAYMRWSTLTLLTMWAVLFLPRQFHVAVVENSNENHILKAMWIFPLYALLLQAFVVPIALGGLASGLPPEEADTFVLSLPIIHGRHWLSGLAFIGGFSAGMSMIVVSAMTMATMITNHIVLPLAETLPALRVLRYYILPCRWVVVVVFLGLGYVFHMALGESYLLVNMGVISFAAALQFVPAIVGGLFWSGANGRGALAGLGGGFAVWVYTILVPAFVRSELLPRTLLESGPAGIGWLRPEALLGMNAMEPLTHGVFWSLVVNVGALMAVSIVTSDRGRERGFAMGFDASLPAMGAARGAHEWESHINVAEKRSRLVEFFAEYHRRDKAVAMVDRCAALAGLADVEYMDIRQLMGLYTEAERLLAGVVGSAAAYKAIRTADLYTARETMELSEVYAQLLAELKLSPEDMAKRIDYQQERERMLTRHAEELTEANRKLRAEIKERQQAEADARDAEVQYRGIFENALEGIFQTTPGGRFLSVNPAMARFLGYDDPGQLINEISEVSEIYDDPARRAEFLFEMEEHGTVSGFEVLFRRRDGSTRWGALYAHARRGEDGRMAVLEGILEDIDERKRAERKLLQANRYVQDIIDSMPSAMIAVDALGAITNWNRAATEVMGITEEHRGDPLVDVCAGLAPVSEALDAALETGQPQRMGKIADGGGGGSRYRDVMVYPLESGGSREVVVRIDDVTDRVRMEEMMVQTEKMMSVGGLAAGMAHEINNPLGGILQAVQNINRRVSDDFPANAKAAEAAGVSLAQVRDYLERRRILGMVDGIRESGTRAAQIVANMLNFTRRNEAGRSTVRVNDIMEAALELASKDYDLKKSYDFRNIEIVKQYADDLPPVLCSRTEIEQVVLNLLKNAAQALFHEGISDKPPVITLCTERRGDWVCIQVADNGPGMDEATRKRVFEPFFTTKKAGEGTGLGLSVSYFIITSKHGGKFSVDSGPDGGAVFTIELPLEPPPDVVMEE